MTSERKRATQSADQKVGPMDASSVRRQAASLVVRKASMTDAMLEPKTDWTKVAQSAHLLVESKGYLSETTKETNSVKEWVVSME